MTLSCPTPRQWLGAACGTTSRLPQLPDAPTVAEQGDKGFEMTQWYGLLAPSRWKPVIARAQIKPDYA